MPDPETKPAARKTGPSLLVEDDGPPLARRRRPNRVVAWLHGWADEHLSREQVGAAGRTLLWVAPLTALIWVYAERQQLQTAENVTLPIAVVPADKTKVVLLLRPEDGNVVVKLRGPKAALDEAIKRFDPRTNPRAEILLERGTSTGEHTLRAVRIKDDKRLAEAGIIVDDVAPEEIRVYVDQIVTKTLPVQVAAAQQPQFGTPVFTPAEVTVSGPERVLGSTTSALRVEADVAGKFAGQRPPEGEAVVKDVKLALAGADATNVTFSHPTVTAKVFPVAMKEAVLTNVRLWPAGPANILNGHDIVIDPSLPDVRVSGPADVIEKLTAPNADAPLAYVQVHTLTTNVEGEVPIDLQLPPGVVVAKDQRMTVRVTLKAR